MSRTFGHRRHGVTRPVPSISTSASGASVACDKREPKLTVAAGDAFILACHRGPLAAMSRGDDIEASRRAISGPPSDRSRRCLAARLPSPSADSTALTSAVFVDHGRQGGQLPAKLGSSPAAVFFAERLRLAGRRIGHAWTLKGRQSANPDNLSGAGQSVRVCLTRLLTDLQSRPSPASA